MQNPKPYPPILGYNETLERRLKTFWDFNDWVGASSSYVGNWIGSASGTGAVLATLSTTADRLGIVGLATGTTSSGRAGYYYGNPACFLFGAGVYTFEADVRIWILSTSTERFALYAGFGETITGAQVDGAYFTYDDDDTHPNWYCVTSSNSTRTTTDSGVAAVAGAWIRLKIVVNANASSVAFYINGANVANNTANIPTGAGRETSALFNIVKSVGTTTRAFYVDYTWLHVDLNASR